MATRLETAERVYAEDIAPFIEAAVAADAALMERVYNRKWGWLSTYFDELDELGDDENPSDPPSCGCLLGSTMLENGTRDWNPRLGFIELRDRLGIPEKVSERAGISAQRVALTLGGNAEGIVFLKQKLRAVLDWHRVKAKIDRAQKRAEKLEKAKPVAV